MRITGYTYYTAVVYKRLIYNNCGKAVSLKITLFILGL